MHPAVKRFFLCALQCLVRRAIQVAVRPSTQISISPSIGRWYPRPTCAERHWVLSPPETFASAKLLAFIREETLGNTYGRAIRHVLDEIAASAQADGFPVPLDAAGALVPLEFWPLPLQAELLVPEKLKHCMRSDGRVPSPYVYGDRPPGMRKISVPLSMLERITAKIVAFGQLTSLARWGSEVLEDELRRLLPDGRELWKLPKQEQVEALLPDEPDSWETALEIMDQEHRQATRSLYEHTRQPDPGADFALPPEKEKDI